MKKAIVITAHHSMFWKWCDKNYKPISKNKVNGVFETKDTRYLCCTDGRYYQSQKPDRCICLVDWIYTKNSGLIEFRNDKILNIKPEYL